MEDNLFWNIIKSIIILIIMFLSLVGLGFIFSDGHLAENVEYYENGIKIEAIQYLDEIYLKKGE